MLLERNSVKTFDLQHILAFLALLTLLLITSACQTSPFLPPPSALTTNHYLGTPLSGPLAGTLPVARPHEALSVRVTFAALEKMPAAALDPVGAYARLVTASRGGTPVLDAGGFALNSRFAILSGPQDFWSRIPGDAYGHSAPMADNRSALPRGVTATFRAADSRPIVDPVTGDEISRFLEIAIHRRMAPIPATVSDSMPAANSPEQLDIWLGIEDLVRPATAPAHAAAEPSISEPIKVPSVLRPAAAVIAEPAALEHENVSLNLPAFDGSLHLAAIVPFAFPGTSTNAVLALVDITPGDDSPEHTNALAVCMEDLQRRMAALAAPMAPRASAEWTGIRTALNSLSSPAVRRPALIFLASETAASLCGDTALVIDDVNLAALTQAVQQAAADPLPTAPSDLGQRFDLQVFQFLCTLQASGKAPTELTAVLSAYAGEPARHADSLEEIQRGLTTRGQLDSRLVAENLIFLEDSAPAARVRAFDWLTTRGKAPPDYDPLAPPRTRRAALEKFLNLQPAAAPFPADGGKP
jgi:hypothetical protein